MHATEGIPCLAMIKLRLAADRFPPQGGVAAPASNLHRAVGAPTGSSRNSVLPTRRGCDHLEQQEGVD
jgi:hypothetical protein